MKISHKNNLKKWKRKNSFDKKFGSKNPPSYHHEMLLRVCLSKRFTNIEFNIFKKNFQILEIGCFSGNNLRFFLENKINCFGSEINKDMINLCKTNLRRFNLISPKIRLGDNLNIDYKSKFFNLLVSINTIHYSYGHNLELAVKEYSRVLKKGGVAIIETPTKNHTTVKKSKKITDFHYLWGPTGFRKKSSMGFVNNLKKFEKILKKYFSKIEINYKNEEYKKNNLSTYFFICKK